MMYCSSCREYTWLSGGACRSMGAVVAGRTFLVFWLLLWAVALAGAELLDGAVWAWATLAAARRAITLMRSADIGLSFKSLTARRFNPAMRQTETGVFRSKM